MKNLSKYFQEMIEEYKKLYPAPAPVFSVWKPRKQKK
jgi:hypothetical protein